MDQDPHRLSGAFGKLNDDVPAPAERSDALWAGTFLMRFPKPGLPSFRT
jgi:hypothetical protein